MSASEEDGRPRRARPAADRLLVGLLAALPVACAWWVYRDVPRIYFFADDFVHFLDIENAGFLRFVSQLFGGHIYVVRNLLFYGLYHLFGFDARPYYWISLLTHLANVWLMFRVGRRLTNGNAVLASLAAAAWGTSPLAVGTVGWFSVYGHQLAASVLLITLERILAAGESPSRGQVARWALLVLAGMTCFGVGVGVAMAFPVVVFMFRPATWRDARLRQALIVFPLLVVGLYFGYRRVYGLLVVMPLSEVVQSNMALRETGPILAMLRHLLVFGVSGLLAGFAFVPTDFPHASPNWLFPALLLAMAAAAVAGDWPTRRRLLALAVLCVTVYTMIAMGRSNAYRAFKIEPWAAARIVRYHYIGLVPIALAACVVLDQLARRLPLAAPVALALWLGFTASRYQRTGLTVEDRSDVRRWVQAGARRIDGMIDSRPPGSTVVIPNEDAPRHVTGPAIGPMEFPGLAGLFVLMHPANVVRDRHVRFLERRPGVFLKSRDPRANHRLADLLVDSEAAAPAPAAP